MAAADPPPKCYLIGAGPGDPGLITMRGAQLLRRVDVVLYDGLVDPALLQLAPQAMHTCVGKHGQSRIWSQREINDEIVRQARAGHSVARLKGGDPAVFARTAEEVEALRAAGIPFEIVPGITAALAAGSYAGIPVTHRGLASAVALVTGHEEPGKPATALDWEALARFPGTLVMYMGVTTAETWTAALIAAGKSPDTPAAIVRRCSWPDQQSVHCRLDEVADRLTPASRMRPPVIVIVGPVTRLAESFSWFDRRPLFGRRILVTRAEHQADDLLEPLRALGAEILHQPAIRITAPDDLAALDAVLSRLDQFDTIVFSSRNGVNAFLERLFATGRDARALAPCRIAAVGSGTAASLTASGLRADVVPAAFHAESLAETLAADAAGQRILLVRANRGREVLAQRLTAAGAAVTEVAAYASRDVTEADPRIAALLAQGEIDWVTVTSSAIARSLYGMFGDDLQRSKLISISPLTSGTLAELGLRATVTADPHTMPALVDALRDWEVQHAAPRPSELSASASPLPASPGDPT